MSLAPVVARAGPRRPVVIGIAGAVAVGKTTIAGALASAFGGESTRVVSTDAFLLPNAVLDERGLSMRKGFPETYELDVLAAMVERCRRGMTTQIPVYSHAVYDLLPGAVEEIEPVDVLIVEGVVALQPPVREVLDLAIYVDAPEEVVRGWFVRRFLSFVEAARSDRASFYHGFASMEEGDVSSFAGATWDAINGVNLREHIGPCRERADLVIVKDAAHTIVEMAGA